MTERSKKASVSVLTAKGVCSQTTNNLGSFPDSRVHSVAPVRCRPCTPGGRRVSDFPREPGASGSAYLWVISALCLSPAERRRRVCAVSRRGAVSRRHTVGVETVSDTSASSSWPFTGGFPTWQCGSRAVWDELRDASGGAGRDL